MVVIKPPEKYNYDMINEFRRLRKKHRSLNRQVERIGFSSMMQLSKEEYNETKKIFMEIRLQSTAISDRLAFLLKRFYGENVIIETEYRILEDKKT